MLGLWCSYNYYEFFINILSSKDTSISANTSTKFVSRQPTACNEQTIVYLNYFTVQYISIRVPG